MKAKRQIIPVFIPHLGCPNDCVFCNQRSISGSAFPATAETVKKAVEDAVCRVPEGGARELAFYGGSFTAIPSEERKSLLDAALPFLRSGIISEIRVSTRPDAIDEERLEILKEYGVKTIELGAQSMDDEVLKASGRGHLSEDTVNAARLIKKNDFKLVLQMMTGLPGDSFEKSLESAKKIISLSPDAVRIYPAVILQGTELFRLWKRGEYKEHTVEEAALLGVALFELFDEAKIPVIRFGLNPSDELSGGEAAGGAYHPALGELARSKMYLRNAKKLLSETPHEKDIIFGVGKGCVSFMTGLKRCNIKALTAEFSLRSVKVRETDKLCGKIVVILH